LSNLFFFSSFDLAGVSLVKSGFPINLISNIFITTGIITGSNINITTCIITGCYQLIDQEGLLLQFDQQELVLLLDFDFVRLSDVLCHPYECEHILYACKSVRQVHLEGCS